MAHAQQTNGASSTHLLSPGIAVAIKLRPP